MSPVITSISLDLATDFASNMCQKITLEPKKKYRLKYDLFNEIEEYAHVIASVNEVQVSSVEIYQTKTFAH